jgi:hypothetical protein
VHAPRFYEGKLVFDALTGLDRGAFNRCRRLGDVAGEKLLVRPSQDGIFGGLGGRVVDPGMAQVSVYDGTRHPAGFKHQMEEAAGPVEFVL